MSSTLTCFFGKKNLLFYFKAHVHPTGVASCGTIVVYKNPAKLKFIQSDRYDKQCEFSITKTNGRKACRLKVGLCFIEKTHINSYFFVISVRACLPSCIREVSTSALVFVFSELPRHHMTQHCGYGRERAEVKITWNVVLFSHTSQPDRFS